MDKELIPYLRKADQYELIDHRFPSSVSLVREKESRKLYVKKSVQFDNEDEFIFIKYFIHEIILLYEFQIDGLPFLKLNGFNLPKDEEEAFIITEYVEGVTLKTMITHKFDNCSDIPTTKMIIIYGIAYALTLIHRKSSYHGYLNPHNIVINKQKEPILTDFGNLYRIKTENNHFLCFNEDDLYRAPEFFSFEDEDEDDKYEPSSSSDVYSFAIIVFQILYGCFCYNGKNIKNPRFNVAKHVLKGRRFDMPDSDVLPKKFKKMITKCWSQKQSERGTMEDIVKTLESGDLVLKGCDMDAYNNYIQKLKTINNQKENKTFNKVEQSDVYTDTVHFEF